MNCKILAICDSERTYADLLSKQLLRMPGSMLEVRNFTEMDKLITFSKERMVTYAVISEKYKHLYQEVEALAYYYLVNSKQEENQIMEGGKSIYRYQPIAEIYQKISGIKTQIQEPQNGCSITGGNKGFKLIGIYNPIHGNGQTTLARSMAKVYGRFEDKVIYLNLEEYPDEIKNLCDKQLIKNGKGDLSDLIYYLKQNKSQAKELIEGLIYKGKNFDVISPFQVNRELCDVSYDYWKEIIYALKEYGYTSVILDVHSCIGGYYELLEFCDKLYSPIREGYLNESKKSMFDKNIRLQGKNQILIKSHNISIPHYQENLDLNVERLCQGYLKEAGEFA